MPENSSCAQKLRWVHPSSLTRSLAEGTLKTGLRLETLGTTHSYGIRTALAHAVHR